MIRHAGMLDRERRVARQLSDGCRVRFDSRTAAGIGDHADFRRVCDGRRRALVLTACVRRVGAQRCRSERELSEDVTACRPGEMVP